MPRDFPKPVDFDDKLARTFQHLGRPGAGGRSSLAAIRRAGRGSGASVIGDGSADAPGTEAAGQLLVLSATGDPIASGGDYVTFDTRVYQHGFVDGVSADGQSITWPISFAGGAIQVEFAWDTYQGGGTVEIEVDGSVPDWGTVVSGSTGQRFVKRRGVHITEGAEVKIKVTHAAGSAQACDVYVEFSAPDPADDASTLLESFFVDSKDSAITSSTITLDPGRAYRIVATGNWRRSNDVYDEGTPDTILYPSSGETAEQAGQDPDTIYAYFEPATYPRHDETGHFRLDWSGGTPAHVEPDGSSVSAPTSGHRYTYTIVGQGEPLSALIFDSPAAYADNNGQVKIEIWRGLL